LCPHVQVKPAFETLDSAIRKAENGREPSLRDTCDSLGKDYPMLYAVLAIVAIILVCVLVAVRRRRA